mmetsp:Transcript_29812/g.75438  ORF Transcript_29812/g.75438 Transcript_29812/m.75438 type:complete len:230 (-) Transcript_29812:605-1294(-)
MQPARPPPSGCLRLRPVTHATGPGHSTAPVASSRGSSGMADLSTVSQRAKAAAPVASMSPSQCTTLEPSWPMRFRPSPTRSRRGTTPSCSAGCGSATASAAWRNSTTTLPAALLAGVPAPVPLSFASATRSARCGSPTGTSPRPGSPASGPTTRQSRWPCCCAAATRVWTTHGRPPSSAGWSSRAPPSSTRSRSPGEPSCLRPRPRPGPGARLSSSPSRGMFCATRSKS